MPHSTIATDFGYPVSFTDVLVDQPLRLLRAVLNRKGAGNAERIEAVEIAAGRQDRRCAQEIAARRGPDELAVERMQDARDLVILLQDAVDTGQILVERQPKCRPLPAIVSGASPLTTASRIDLSGRTPCDASATACSISTRCSAEGVSPTTCRPCGIRVYSSSSTAFESLPIGLRRIGPGRLRLSQFERAGLGLDQCRKVTAFGIVVRRQAAPSLDRRL